MSQPKVSLIIPVYNCEKYLSRCLNSVLSQTETDFEVILINDGSTDSSGMICDDYAARDHRIRVIHQENAGVSAARNAGLDVACGEYIGFVDADDYVVEDMLMKLCGVVDDCSPELVIFDPYVHDHGNNKVFVDSFAFYPQSVEIYKQEISPECLRYIAGTVWRCLYKRSVLNEFQIRFDVTLPLSEDRLFNIMAIGCTNLIYYYRQPLYHYHIVPGSAVRKYRPDILDIVLNTHSAMSSVILELWGQTYLDVYEKVNLVDGAMLCVYNYFSRTNNLSITERYRLVRLVVDNAEISNALSKLSMPTIREWLAKHKCAKLLSIIGWLWNIKNRQ